MAKDPYPSETSDRYIVRFPDGMRDRLKQEAAKNGRSMNAEIIQRLEFSFSHDDHIKQRDGAPAPTEADYGMEEANVADKLNGIQAELAELKAVLLDTWVMPNGEHEYLIKKVKRTDPRPSVIEGDLPLDDEK